MKRKRTEGAFEKRGHTILRSVFAVILPVFALATAAAFVLLCIAYGGVHPVVTIELGEESPAVGAFLRTEREDAAYVSAPEARYRKAGDYRLSVHADGRTVPVLLQVRDTQPPTADGMEMTVPAKQPLSPDRLIRNLRDESVVKVSYETAPDYDAIGDYDAIVLLEDASGNRTRVSSTVHVRTVTDGITLEAGAPAPEAD